MKSLGIDFAKLLEHANNPNPPEIVPTCPGAKLRILRSDYDNLAQRGEVFATSRNDIPFDGLGDARIRCDQEVAKLPKTAAGHAQYYGLCHSCSGLEADNRRILRERAKAKGNT